MSLGVVDLRDATFDQFVRLWFGKDAEFLPLLAGGEDGPDVLLLDPERLASWVLQILEDPLALDLAAKDLLAGVNSLGRELWEDLVPAIDQRTRLGLVRALAHVYERLSADPRFDEEGRALSLLCDLTWATRDVGIPAVVPSDDRAACRAAMVESLQGLLGSKAVWCRWAAVDALAHLKEAPDEKAVQSWIATDDSLGARQRQTLLQFAQGDFSRAW